MQRLSPTGVCWCGCGKGTPTNAYFLPGHDKIAESAVILAEYGGVPRFLEAHGYGPDGENPSETLKKYRNKMPWKYQPLADYLAAQTSKQVTRTFLEIEKMLGEPLPSSASIHRAWWSNSRQGHPHAKAWLDNGWQTEAVDFDAETVTFTQRVDAKEGTTVTGIQTGAPGTKYIRFTIDAWYQEDDGEIHIASNQVPNFHTTVNNKPGSKRYHANLYSRLKQMLQEAGRWPEGKE